MKTVIIIVAAVAILFWATKKLKEKQKKEAENLGTYDIPEDLVIFEEAPYVEEQRGIEIKEEKPVTQKPKTKKKPKPDKSKAKKVENKK